MCETAFIREHPELIERAAMWFSQRWDVPAQAYCESMEASVAHPYAVPQWLVAQEEDGRIVAGAGVIDNDFHGRADLAPNLCALYVEPGWRGRGLARRLVALAREEAARLGFPTLYLVTDHVGLYERLGWEFVGMAPEDGGGLVRVYAAPAVR